MNTTTQLPDKGTLIAPAYMHSALRFAYLEKGQGTFGLSIVTLSTFLNKYQHTEHKDEVEILLLYRQRVQALICPIYQNIVDSLDFLKQCSTFIEHMKFYGITVQDLPQKTSAQIEMKAIISAIYDIATKQDSTAKALDVLSTKTLDNVYIMDAYYTYQEAHILSRLESSQATRVHFEQVRKHTAFYHAINKRKEVEAMAQCIVREKQNSEDINIVVCDATYKALIAQVFHRYLIPYTIVKDSSSSIITKRFLLLLKYYQNPSIDFLIELIQCNTFKAPYLQDFISYLQLFDMQIEDSFTHISKHGKVSELISESELKRLCIIEEHAQQTKDILWPMLEKLRSIHDLKEVFLQVNEIASATIKVTNSRHIATLKQLHSLIKLVVKYIDKKEDISFAIDLLSSVQESASSKEVHGAFISDSNAPLPPRKTCYMLGCTQKNYPGTPILKGLFDEAYVKEIANYPTMRERYDVHMKQYIHQINVCENFIVSYPLGGYDGKGNESALEMEQLLQMKSTSYPLYEHYQKISSDFHITQESAEKLFVKDGVIPGSISSFERYIRCPFSYFLSYALQLREPITYCFTPQRLGTLSHYVLEILVEKYDREYANASLEEVAEIVEEELQAMANVYPSFRPRLAITKKRMLHNLSKNLVYLQDMEAHAHLSSFESEREFWWNLPLQDDIKIRLHGFIDRIDFSSGYARIIDYKSSIKTLQEKDVFAGLQLQLLTYALYVEEDAQKQILGVYYYSLKQENITMIDGAMKRRPVQYQVYGKEDYEALSNASNKLQGWTMENDVDLIDDDGSHIQGVRQNKDGLIVARKTYDLSVLKQHLSTIYETIGKRIIRGDIACNPTDDACMFCPYGDICRFSKVPRIVSPLVDVDETIYKGGA